MIPEAKIQYRKQQLYVAGRIAASIYNPRAWNGQSEFYFSDPAVEKDPKTFKAELAFLIKD